MIKVAKYWKWLKLEDEYSGICHTISSLLKLFELFFYYKNFPWKGKGKSMWECTSDSPTSAIGIEITQHIEKYGKLCFCGKKNPRASRTTQNQEWVSQILVFWGNSTNMVILFKSRFLLKKITRGDSKPLLEESYTVSWKRFPGKIQDAQLHWISDR